MPLMNRTGGNTAFLWKGDTSEEATTDLEDGDLYSNTEEDLVKVYDGTELSTIGVTLTEVLAFG